MSKYRELLERAKSVTGERDCIILALTTALRELEAFNDEHQSLHSLMQMQIEKLEARVAELEEAQKALDEDFSERTEELIRSNARVAELEWENETRARHWDKASESFAKLEAERDRLRELVAELADEVEAGVKARYCHPDGTLVYESYSQRLDRDMEIVSKSRAALAGKEE